MTTSFTELLSAAQQQAQPQRLLFLFAKADRITNGSNAGSIEPVMCSDKLPEDLDTFQSLVNEADQISTEWDFVIIAGLDGSDGKVATDEMTEAHLKNMADNLVTGENLSQYLILDRQEMPIVLQTH